jgi:hypothetical protein
VALHFLYLTNTRLVSMATRGKRIVARREFAVSGAGAAEFERYLAGMASDPVHLFTDLSEEDFRLDTIPHVGARDREAILARKLSQIFRNTPYRHAVMQGRESEGRRDDRVIYTAITNPEVLRPWVDVMERLRVPLAGIYSAAVFSAVMLEELDIAFRHTLLVTFTPGDAMRQTYFRDGEIKFSRLTPVDLEEGQTLGAMIADETTRTWQYLDSLRHFGSDDRLEVCVLVHASDRASVQPELRDFAQIQHRLIDIEQASTKLGLRPAPLDSTAEEVLVHLYLLRRSASHFASSELRRYATLRQVRIAVDRASVAILAAGVAWGGWNVARSYTGSEVDAAAEQRLAEINQEYDAVTRAMPSFGVGGATMRDVVSFYSSSIKPFPALAGFVERLSTVLGRHAGIQLTQLSWQAADDPNVMPAMSRSAPAVAPPVKSVRKAADASAAAPVADPNAANPPFAGGRYAVALLEGTVHADADGFRNATERVARLAAEIGRIPGFRADVVESPLDVRSSLALQGRLVDSAPAEMDLRFLLRIVHDRGPET